MAKTCAVCKTNSAVISAKIADKETGVYSAPIALCEECYKRVSKARKTETVQDPDLANAPGKTTVTSIAPTTATEPVYLKNFYGLSNFCDDLKGVFWVVLFIGIIGSVFAFINGLKVLGIASASGAVYCLTNIVLFHILSRTFEGIADYMKRK